MTRIRTRIAAASLAAPLLIAGCGSSTAEDSTATAETSDQVTSSGIRLVSPDEAAQIQADPPADLVILDVRTAEEFQEGHLEDAVMLDFYREDFAQELAQLDPDQPYLLYCRSGNRSGQTATIMEQLGFADVADIDGGIVAWGEASLPVVSE